MFFLNNKFIEFGRGKDKQKRKRRGMLIAGGVGLGALAAGGIGLALASKNKNNVRLPSISKPNIVSNNTATLPKISNNNNSPLDQNIVGKIQENVNKYQSDMQGRLKEGYDKLDNSLNDYFKQSRKEENTRKVMERRKAIESQLKELKEAKDGVGYKEGKYKKYKDNIDNPELYEKYRKQYKNKRVGIKSAIRQRLRILGYSKYFKNEDLILFKRGKDKKKRAKRMGRFGAKVRIGTVAGMGGLVGSGLGMLTTRSRKGTLIGGGLGSALLGTSSYLEHKKNPYSPIGKKKARNYPNPPKWYGIPTDKLDLIGE